ncbi:GntR family transcriptional regulator (plasmid) [Paraburkholderia aromaticivorans]|uniref:GntR family transcriptional regulator n=1 Tax=Paraburkholderia aromaticivorans TaxID=2026199 RepID=A0A248VZN4_9BURK|nr:GntR family transcriptional regulator [Paraburkholderia aromaticivorans]
MTRRASATISTQPSVTDAPLRYRLIHDQLKNAIALGKIAPGLVLLEGPVARVFGTSRVPVRKAFEMLHAGGLLHTFEGRGYVVASPDGSAPPPLRAPLSESALGFDEAHAPLALPSNSERIYHAMEAAVSIGITFGHFRIDESEAAEAFGVSRGTVREALSRLRDLGLVEKSAYSHWLCGPLTARAVAHDYELRVLLEPAALRASMPHLSKEKLTLALAEVERAIDEPDSIDADALERIETALHVECLSQAPNKKLLGMIGHAHMPLTVNHAFYNAFNLHPEAGTLVEHRAVLKHLLAGSTEAAVTALADHLHAGQKRTLQRLKVLAVLPEPDLPVFMHRIS